MNALWSADRVLNSSGFPERDTAECNPFNLLNVRHIVADFFLPQGYVCAADRADQNQNGGLYL